MTVPVMLGPHRPRRPAKPVFQPGSHVDPPRCHVRQVPEVARRSGPFRTGVAPTGGWPTPAVTGTLRPQGPYRCHSLSSAAREGGGQLGAHQGGLTCRTPPPLEYRHLHGTSQGESIRVTQLGQVAPRRWRRHPHPLAGPTARAMATVRGSRGRRRQMGCGDSSGERRFCCRGTAASTLGRASASALPRVMRPLTARRRTSAPDRPSYRVGTLLPMYVGMAPSQGAPLPAPRTCGDAPSLAGELHLQHERPPTRSGQPTTFFTLRYAMSRWLLPVHTWPILGGQPHNILEFPDKSWTPVSLPPP